MKLLFGFRIVYISGRPFRKEISLPGNISADICPFRKISRYLKKKHLLMKNDFIAMIRQPCIAQPA